jgi:hypothetical protein
MPACRLGLQHPLILVGLVLASAVPRAAGAEDDSTLNEIVELNKRALVTYEKLDVPGAAALLEQALALCGRANLSNHPAAARTHIHLGVVYVSGLKMHAEGLVEFRKALAIDPRINITKSLLNPEVQAAFDQAKQNPGPPVESAPGVLAQPLPGQVPAPQGPGGPPRREHPAIQHPPVTRAIRGQAVAIKVQVPPGLGAAKVVLAYRAEDSDQFLVREMVPVKEAPGWFEEEIPAEATQGTRVSYYLEAQNPDDLPIAANGTAEQPYDVSLAPEVTMEDLPPAEPAAPAKEDHSGTSAPAGFWMVLALGSGGGYHSGTPEMNPVDTGTPPQGIHVEGYGLAKLGQLAPEIGYFPRSRLVVSVQGRLQYVTGTQEVKVESRRFHAARLALAGIAKLTWFLRAPPHRLRPFVNLQAGVGQIRHSVTTPASASLTGCGPDLTCKDTVMGGLGLAGLGGGMVWMLDPTFGIYGALSLLAGFPSFVVNGDLNLGIAVTR